MVIRYKKKTQSQKRFIMVVSLTATVIIILIGALSGLLFGASYIVDQSLSDPDVLVNPSLSGNDIVVTIYEGRRLHELTQLSVEIEGYSPVVRDVQKGAHEVVFTGIAVQITETRTVGVRGIFIDGTVKLLKVVELKFT
ncbi:hypothetical protein SDC9_23539 [bioreactor metagenome]|uniref:Uncharacterized protein n=1 Tax=bioreactor metagenome TaxID=1076179 RepID=A0A644UFS5_9ZZZZ|nr:hypothetical protein [Methanocorpusculum sp.]